MSNPALKTLLNEYEKTRLSKQMELEDKLNHFYEKNPSVLELNRKMDQTSIAISKTILQNNDSEKIKSLNRVLDQLKKEKKELLNQLNITEDFFVPNYTCKLCEDTGYLVNNNQVMCNCLKQKLLNVQYNKANISSLERDHFQHFNLSLFSDKVDENKYNSNISPRENMKKIKEIALAFIQNFDDATQKNLLFTGNTGLGKTFLTNCIANEILQCGKRFYIKQLLLC